MARAARLDHRDRCLVAWCGAVPDVDAVTLLLGVDAYLRGHHVYLHNLCAAVLAAVLAAILATRRAAVLALGLAAFLLHLVSDGFGLLELRPLWPLSRATWWPGGGSYAIAAVGEILVPLALLAWGAAVFRRERVSVLEALTPRLDAWMVGALERHARAQRAPRITASARGSRTRRAMEQVLGGVILYAALAVTCNAVLAVIAESDWSTAMVLASIPFAVIRWLLPWLVVLGLRRYARAFALPEHEGSDQR